MVIGGNKSGARDVVNFNFYARAKYTHARVKGQTGSRYILGLFARLHSKR